MRHIFTFTSCRELYESGTNILHHTHSTVQVSVFLYHEKMGESIFTPPPFSVEVDCTKGKLAQNKTVCIDISQFITATKHLLVISWILLIKIQIFWEGHKISKKKNLPTYLELTKGDLISERFSWDFLFRWLELRIVIWQCFREIEAKMKFFSDIKLPIMWEIF